MKQKRIYRLTIDDESHLRTRLSVITSPLRLWLGAACFVVLLLIIASLLVIYTPLHRLLPGRPSESQLITTQQALMRIDSIAEQVDNNRIWMENFLKVTNVERQSSDSLAYAGAGNDYNPDSLADASPMERKFVSAMEERERFNISVLAPLDADGMLFVPVSPNGYYTDEARKATDPAVSLADDAPLHAVADGTVLAVYHNASTHGYTVLIQHGRGFVTCYSHLGTPLVLNGDAVNAGQPVAFPPAPDARNHRWIQVRIWHNGTPLVPYRFIGT